MKAIWISNAARGRRPNVARGALRLAALLCIAAFGCDADPAPPPAPIGGEALYVRHCVSCHGISGKGDGPVAASLAIPPADLTKIASRAGGRFDEKAVMRIIDGRRAVAAHGSREMPVWGAVFGDELEGQRVKGYTVLLHARALADYLRSIQQN